MGAKLNPINITNVKVTAGADDESKELLDNLQDRVVYSPHIYGPDVFHHYYFDFPDLRETLDYMWDTQFGWLIPQLDKGVIVGKHNIIQ